VRSAGHTVIRTWPDDDRHRSALAEPRHGLFSERRTDDGSFAQQSGPFAEYERQLAFGHGRIVERTRYRLMLPWFGWLFALPIRLVIGRRGRHGLEATHRRAWWAPPDQMTERHVLVLGLMAATSMASAFTNTVFTQTAQFASEDFGIGDRGYAVASAVVRAGIILAMPIAVLADRLGRKRMIRFAAFAAPLVTSLGALAPSFPLLVATQSVGRPLGLALDFLIAVVVVEEMPRNSRAYAVSVMAMASGLGAGVAVMALRLADLGPSAWRLVYVVTLIWLVVAVDVSRRLPETERFERPHTVAPRLDRGRFATLALVAFAANFFVAPASAFQNRYLREVRGFDAGSISLFTLGTSTPAGIGLILGGHLADVRGRRMLIAVAIPAATALVLGSFAFDGWTMWACALLGGFVGGIAYPALAVYRAELFPTGNRGRAAGLLTASALIGGIGGLLLVGERVRSGGSYFTTLGLVALGQLVVVTVVLTRFPETAHRELEQLNPEDRPPGG
jgi:MFS family permease